MTYLQMNGTTDYIQLPAMSVDKVVIDGLVNEESYNQYVLATSSWLARLNSGTTNSWFVSGGSESGFTGTGSRVTFTITATAVNNINGNSSQELYQTTNGNLYDVKFYNGSTLVAHYDMSTGTVADQSGNGNNATLYGGTWVSTTPTNTPVALSAADTTSLTDSAKLSVSSSIQLSASDSVSLTDSSSLSVSIPLTTTDSIMTSESVNLSVSKRLMGSDSVILSDSANMHVATQNGLSASDTSSIMETVSLSISKPLTSTDQITQSDTANVSVGKTLSASDSITTSESHPTLTQIISLSGEDTTTSSDSSTMTLLTSFSASDHITIGDALSLAVKRGLIGQDTSITVDSARLSNAINLQSSDQITTHDTVAIYFPNKVIVSHVTLDGNRQLYVSLKGNRELHVTLKGGVDVTATNQNFDVYAGENKIIDIPNVTDDSGTLDLTSCQDIWFIAKRGSSQIYKDLTNGVKATSATGLSVTFLPANTSSYTFSMNFEIWCKDSQGNESVLTTGILTINPALVKT